jgi:cytochrome c peroxidase
MFLPALFLEIIHDSRPSDDCGSLTGRVHAQRAKQEMNRNRALLVVVGLVLSGFTACGGTGSNPAGQTTPPTPPPNTSLQTFQDANGTIATFSQVQIDNSNPFFAKLGTNDRTCASCHDAADGMSIAPTHLQQRFQSTQGTDPVFRAVDGANCPSADVSTLAAKTSAYSLLLNSGLIRMTIPMPANADFSIVSITDPYQCPETTATQPALYRRPLPSTNLKFLNGLMWDGREPDLPTQAKNATLVHAQSSALPSDAQIQQIVSFESALFTAQSEDSLAGDLTAQGANGGPVFLSTQPFSPGINSGSGFNANAFNLYTNWANATGTNAAAQQSVVRGEMLFNSFPMRITNVPGLNDVQGQPSITGTCTTCHNTPNAGSDSTFTMMNIGTGSPKANLPAYQIQCNDGSQVSTTDPGRAMVTGLCTDIGKFKVPGMRGLAARAPYFHNGTALTLLDVVNFYDQRFNMLLTDDQKTDLVAFMNTL